MKITIISDVHIGNYPNYETFPFERLLWYRNYAEEVVAKSKEVGSEYLFIAGDLSDRSTNPPEIQNMIRDVINIFDAYFTQIYYINGQHDLKTKNYDNIDNDTQSALHAMATNKMAYGDSMIIPLGGKTIAMMDFNPEPDLSWIENKVDLFISHVTINTSGFGSEVDYDKFTLGIVGDIHYPCHKNNLHSVGVGVPRYLGDNVDGTYVICDLDDLSFERITVDPNHEWLTRYVKTTDESKEGPSDEKLSNGISPKYYYIYKPEISIDDTHTILTFDDDKVDNINKILETTIRENGLEEIHGKVLNLNKSIESVDLNFKLISLTIHNIRSIDDHTINFSNKQGTLQITSENGGGKSTIIWSLYYALKGGLDIRNEVREGCDDSYVQLTLEYQHKIYCIYRGVEGSSLDIDGKWQDLGNKRDTEAGILERLPFIYFIDSFFFADDSTRILGSYSADRRIELLSTYYRLDVLDAYHNTAEFLVNDMQTQAAEIWDELQETNKEYASYQEILAKEKKKIENYPSRTSLNESIEKNKLKYKEILVLESKLAEYNLDLGRSKVKLKSLEQSLSKIQDAISHNTRLKSANEKKLLVLPKGVSHNDLDNRWKDCCRLMAQYQYDKKQLDASKELLTRYDKAAIIKCPTCDTDIHLIDYKPTTPEDIKSLISTNELALKESEDLYRTNYKDYKILEEENNAYTEYRRVLSSISELSSTLDLLHKEYDLKSKEVADLKSKITEASTIVIETPSSVYEEEIEKYQKMISDYDHVLDLTKQIEDSDFETKIKNLSTTYDKYTEECNKYYKYINLFSHNGEFYKLVLESIVSKFNSSRFKYEVISATYRGKTYNDIIGYYKDYRMKYPREYSHCSNGQKTLLDLDFIKNLLTSSSIVVFDDFLGYLTTENLMEGLRIIHDMKPNLKILTSQNENSTLIDSNIVLAYNGETTEFIKE